MVRRPPGKGSVANKLALALVLLVVPWLAEAQQQQPKPSISVSTQESIHEDLVHDVLHTLEATRLDEKLETPLISNRRKNTLSANNNDVLYDASAIATLAPADPAVRAPVSRRSGIETAGSSSPQLARSLEDWEVEDFVLLATVDGKLYARDRKTGKERWTLEVDQPMVETTYHKRNRSMLEEDSRPVDDYLWIVEPSRDGSIYVYIPSGSHGGLINTGLTMKKLVEEMSPFKDDEPPVVYTGDKKTTMLTIDARTGTVLRLFGSGGSLVTDAQSCPTTGLLNPDDDECSTSGTLTLGRTEYTVGIQGIDGHQIAMLKYSEWGPNNFDTDLHRQYQTTKDGKYVYPKHDGSIFSYDFAQSTGPNRLFNQKFPSPVVRVFDVARPWGSNDKNPELIVLPQPVPPLWNDESLDMRSSRIFLNHTEDGSWYAMSGNSYPFAIEGPELAICDHREWWQHGNIWGEMNDAQLSKALVGLHRIDSDRTDRLLTISGPPGKETENTIFTEDSVITTTPEVPTVTERLRQIPQSAVASFSDFVYNPIVTLIAIAVLLLYNKDLIRWAKAFLRIPSKSVRTKSGVADIALEVHERERAIPTELMAAPTSVEVTVSQNATSSSMAESDPAANGNDLVTKQAAKLVEDADEAAQPEKLKKGHRGKRGGIKHKKGQAARATSKDPGPTKTPATVEDAVRDAQKLGGKSNAIEPDVQTLPNGVADISGPIIRMGSLEVNTDKLIGTGSNGTMVFEGNFDGRSVAVKRMLIQFFDIASQETKLLRESDDHPNGTHSLCTVASNLLTSD